MTLAKTHAAALADATGGLKEFRRGWARSQHGPFYPRKAIETLLARGLVKLTAGHYRVVPTEAGEAHLADRFVASAS